MIVRRLVLEGFMLYDSADIEFPEKGLVVVTGKNGRGKSALVEAVSTAAFGSTIRGTQPWRPGSQGKVELRTATHRIVREATKGGKKSLEWVGLLDREPTKFATVSKAEEALESVIGSFDVWSRTSVFAAHDAAKFSESTDAQRKLLLETLLGLEQFDEALRFCREAKRVEEVEVRREEAEVSTNVRWVEDRERRLVEARATLESVGEEIDEILESVRLERLERLREQVAADSETVAGTIQTVRSSGSDLRSELGRVERELELLGSGKCPTCGQAIDEEEMLQPLRLSAEELRPKAEEALETAAKERERLEERDRELRLEARRLSDGVAEIRARLRSVETTNKARESAERTLDTVEEELRAFEENLRDARTRLEVASHQKLVLEAAETVLGLRGVRSAILGRTLEGLSTVANGFLSRMAAPGAKIVLRPYSEKKSGAVVDAISLDVEGWGGGFGYRADSAGQRRRVDLSLLLGLATIADAALSRTPGDLWFDEVFDGLDDDGVAAVSEIIREIAEERKVVVISHNPALVEHLREHAEVHFEVFETDEGASEIRRIA